MHLFNFAGRSGLTALFAVMIGGMIVTACGFSPVYGTRSGANGQSTSDSELAATSITIIEDREGQVLHNLLLDRFNPNGRPRAARNSFTVELSISSQDLGTQIDATTTRSRLTVQAVGILKANGQSVRFESRAVASFSTSESDYAALVARQDATDRSLQVIADDLRLQVITYFEKQRLLNG